MTPEEMISKLATLCEELGNAVKNIDARMSAIEAKVAGGEVGETPEKPAQVAMVPGTPAAADPAHPDAEEDKKLIREELEKLTSSYSALAAAANKNFALIANELKSIRAAMGKLATDKAEVDPGKPTVTLNTGSKTPANSEQIRNSQDNKVVYGEERRSMSAAAIKQMLSKYPSVKTDGLVDETGGISEARLNEALKAAGIEDPKQRLAMKIQLGGLLNPVQ